jgi:hypothetical protein
LIKRGNFSNIFFRHGTTYFEGYKKAGLFQHFSGRKRGSIDDLGTGKLRLGKLNLGKGNVVGLNVMVC